MSVVIVNKMSRGNMFYFSAHKDLSLHHYRYSQGWEVQKAEKMSDVALKCNYVTSPILWLNGERRSEKFSFADMIVLDSDNGELTLRGAKKKFKKFQYVIGTTKSHRKVKNGVKCDRLRIYLRLDRSVDMLDLYKFMCMRIAKYFGCDTAATDGARMFMPCKPVYIQDSGGIIGVEPFESLLVKQIALEAAQFEGTKHFRKKYMDTRCLPPFIMQMLSYGIRPDESRNKACFKIGIYATEAGFTIEEIVQMIMESPIPINQYVRLEVEQAVRSGAKRAKRSI